jgi:hypothetical protein
VVLEIDQAGLSRLKCLLLVLRCLHDGLLSVHKQVCGEWNTYHHQHNAKDDRQSGLTGIGGSDAAKIPRLGSPTPRSAHGLGSFWLSARDRCS